MNRETFWRAPADLPASWSRTRRVATRLCVRLVGLVASVFVILMLWPDPLFAYRLDGGSIVIHSDRPIPPEIGEVLQDVGRRIGTSQLPAAGPYQVYLCNDTWKLGFFGHKLSTGFGGITDVYLTRHIFIRPSDIARNAVVPPASWRFPLTDRPLSYFIAHEIIHVQQVAALGRFAYFRAPSWLLEGYADHVGKGGDFDFDRNLRALHEGRPEMDPGKGLYNRYQLAVDLLLKASSFLQLVANPPDPEAVLGKAAMPGS